MSWSQMWQTSCRAATPTASSCQELTPSLLTWCILMASGEHDDWDFTLTPHALMLTVAFKSNTGVKEVAGSHWVCELISGFLGVPHSRRQN
jgi:hypothetical protein